MSGWKISTDFTFKCSKLLLHTLNLKCSKFMVNLKFVLTQTQQIWIPNALHIFNEDNNRSKNDKITCHFQFKCDPNLCRIKWWIACFIEKHQKKFEERTRHLLLSTYVARNVYYVYSLKETGTHPNMIMTITWHEIQRNDNTYAFSMSLCVCTRRFVLQLLRKSFRAKLV